MAEQSAALIKTVRAIDKFTDTTGTWLAWLNLPLVMVVSYEVIARYAFNAPTLWSFDVKWTATTRGMVDSISYVLFFFPSLIMLFAASGGEALYAFSIHEVSEQTPWRPIRWPYKTVVPLTCVLLMVQGVSETIKSLYAWR